MTLTLGQPAPDFAMDGVPGPIRPADLLGHPVVLYFYPKDDTSGCTTEAKSFRDQHAAFQAAKITVIGVSRDSLAAHEKFRAKHELPFPLGSDADGLVCEAFGVWTEKSMYGRKYFGIERSTFLIDGAGVLRAEWRKVKVPGHVDAVLKAAAELVP